MYLTDFLNDIGEFIQFDEFGVNLPFTTALKLKKSHLFTYEWQL